MLAALIIVFREVLEAGLVVGIVLAATRGVPRRGLWIAGGILGGVLGSCVVAAFTGSISVALEGTGQELFNVVILLAAVAMLAWHNVWMAQHGRAIAGKMKAVGSAVAEGASSLAALAVVVGVAVLREGAEVALFLYGISVSGNDAAMMAAGGALGLLGGVAMAAMMYLGLLRIPTRHLFRVTSWLIALLAAGMASQAVALLQQAQIVTAFSHMLWNTSDVISNSSWMGKVLHTLVGYTERPTAMQLIAYLATLGGIFGLMRLYGGASVRPQPEAAV